MKKNTPLLALATLFMLAFAGRVNAQKIFVLTNNDMFYQADAMNPTQMTTPMAVTGLASGMELVGMDVRPATGQLYLLGYDAAMQKGQVYTLDTLSGMLSPVGQGIMSFQLGGKVGFDFNPTVDRIRVVSSQKHDYRLHPGTGALVATDGMLMYAPNDVNAGKNPNIGSGAYSNSYIGATATTLYNYDDSLNVFTIQNPPNNGIQNTIGSSGLVQNLMDASSDLDIYFDPMTMQNKAFFVANTGMNTQDSLYTVNLMNGTVMPAGALGMAVKDIAVMISRTPPVLNGTHAWALTATNNLVRFNTAAPSYLISAVPVTGLTAGQNLVGMDMRPVDLKVYGIGYNPATMVARIYTINPETGAATPVSADSITNIDLSGNVGVDFNPVADRIRVVTSNNKNYRLNQLTGLLAANDSILKYNTGDVNFGADPDVATVAYTNSRVAPGSTLLYAYDDVLNVLLTQNPPNDGILNTVGSSGLTMDMMDKSSDLDIYYDHDSQMNIAYFAGNTNGANDKLYAINLTTGATTELGVIGMGIAVRDIVVQLDSTPAVTSVFDQKRSVGALTAYPNPMAGEVTLRFTLQETSAVRISLLDVTGRQLSDIFNGTADSGENTVGFDASALPAGIYFLQMENQEERSVFKLVK